MSARTRVTELGPGNYRRIAKVAGLSSTHVSRALRGERGLSLVIAARIARAANVTLDELYTHISASPRHRPFGRRTRAEAALIGSRQSQPSQQPPVDNRAA